MELAAQGDRAIIGLFSRIYPCLTQAGTHNSTPIFAHAISKI